jgi:hypothetical protein
MREDAPQRRHALQASFNDLCYVMRYGIAWRAVPNDLPPWSAVYQQSHRWLAAGCEAEPSAAIVDSRTMYEMSVIGDLQLLENYATYRDALFERIKRPRKKRSRNIHLYLINYVAIEVAHLLYIREPDFIMI